MRSGLLDRARREDGSHPAEHVVAPLLGGARGNVLSLRHEEALQTLDGEDHGAR